MDSGCPLLDKTQNIREQKDWNTKLTMTHYESFPIRASVSSHNILLDTSSPQKQQQRPQTSVAGIWRTPFSQQPIPSIQPVRIDIPVTRAGKAQLNPPFSTFQSSSIVSAKKGQTLKVNGQIRSIQSQENLYASPISSSKKLPQLSLLSQQQRGSTLKGQAIKPQISLSPVKHVSFQEPPFQQKKITSPAKRKETQEPCDPWRREAQEKQQWFLQQEVRELQAKAKPSVEENQRLHKLSLELQFQSKLQELQQRGEDEEGAEDLDMMMTVLQLERRVQVILSSLR